MRHLNKVLTNYLRIECNQVKLPDKAFLPDLKTIAIGKDSIAEEAIKVYTRQSKTPSYLTDTITQLLKIILLATLTSPRANYYLERMPKLSVPAQESLKSIIEEVWSYKRNDVNTSC